MKSVYVNTILHDEQRYNTPGDYWIDPSGAWNIAISDFTDWRFAFLVAIHELAEIAFITWQGIEIHRIDDFDKEYEKNRKPGDVSEPGDDPRAPYYHAHQAATIIERVAAVTLGVVWKEYEVVCNEMMAKYKKI